MIDLKEYQRAAVNPAEETCHQAVEPISGSSEDCTASAYGSRKDRDGFGYA